jgi:hypothetical protein
MKTTKIRITAITLSTAIVLTLAACTKSSTQVATSEPAPATSSQAPGANVAEMPMPVEIDGVTFRYESGNALLNSTHIKSVKPTKSDGENYAVLITFTKDGSEILATATANMIGQEMSLYIYDEQVFSAELTTAIYDGELLIGGNYTKEKADSMAESIKAGLNGEPLPTEEPTETPQGIIAPGDFPEGWNDMLGTVSIADFSEKVTEIDPNFSYVENPLGFLGGTALTTSGWSNGTVAVVPYQIDTLEPQVWGVAFGNSGDLYSAGIVLYENAHATFFWLDEAKGEMSAPLACALWLAAEGTIITTTPQERQTVWEDAREFIKTVSIMGRELGYEYPERVPVNGSTDTAASDIILDGFDFFREIGFSSDQQEILQTTLREFFHSNYPDVKSITIESNTLSRDMENPDISNIYLTIDTDRIFQIKLDTQASIRKLAVSIYDESGNLLN